jgi:spore germination cell wall hydrolase CwlJ-like protein
MKRLVVALVLLIFAFLPIEANASEELANHEQFKGEVRVEMEPWFGNYTYEDLYLLAHIINAEAGGDTSYISDQCVFGVGSVVLNRVKDPRFPNTIREVLWQPGQYYNGWHGAITKEPVDRSWQIAAELLEEGPIFPPEVVWQANFTQGRGTYLYTDGMYFCY